MEEALKRTPLYEKHVAAGARLVPFAGWEMPVQYTGVLEEHRAVREAVGLFDVSHMGEIIVRGRDAEAYLQRLTPNNVAQLTPGRAHYSGLLTDAGTYIDDLLIYRMAPAEFLVVVNAANTDKDFAWMESRRQGDVELDNASDRYALLALQGPRAVETLAPLVDPAVLDLKYYRFTQGTVAGRPALISRTGYTGEDGFELYMDPGEAPRTWDELVEAGASSGLLLAGLGARDTLRLEAGMALYGHDIDDTTTPLEAGLDWVVKLDKGDFIGRQVLVNQQREGIARKLVGFELEERGIAREGCKVMAEGKEVGKVTSGTFAPTLERAIGMTYLPLALAEPGTEIAVEVRGKRRAARVVALPFYRRSR